MKNSTTALGNAEPEFYSTCEAAERLGLSLGTVQKMVETGALNAWKTAGGHRRVIASSVTSYMNARESNVRSVRNQHLSILVVEDDEELQKLYALNVADWGIVVNLQIVADGLTALLFIAKHRPDIVIAARGGLPREAMPSLGTKHPLKPTIWALCKTAPSCL